MGRWRRTTACERAAQWISLDLDDELSELEQSALARHLERCQACAALQTQVTGFTLLMRADPPVAPRMPGRITVTTEPGAGRIVRRGAATLVLAAAIAASLFGLAALQGSSDQPASGLGLLPPAQRLAFVHVEHVRVEPQTALLVDTVPASPFAARVLV